MKALRGYRFADVASHAHAVEAFNPDRPSAFLIYGEAATGKSRLARAILGKLGIDRPLFSGASTSAQLSKHLDLAADGGAIILDLGRRMLSAPVLHSFLTARLWAFRRGGRCELCEVASSCVTLITTHYEPPDDLRRRCKVIHLIARNGGRR